MEGAESLERLLIDQLGPMALPLTELSLRLRRPLWRHHQSHLWLCVAPQSRRKANSLWC